MRKKLRNLVDRLTAALQAVDGDIHVPEGETPYANFKESRSLYYKRDLKLVVSELKSLNVDLLGSDNAVNEQFKVAVSHLSELYDEDNVIGMLDISSRLVELIPRIPEMSVIKLSVPKVPGEISSEIAADVHEIEKCFQAECYRSSTILCGRILEVALHRTYFDVTGTDILETNPGIGLGKLIAKLKEKNMEFEPGITEQIHLINQVRVSSVHKKSQAFSPSKEQAHAIILFTLDVLKKLFN